ncbi:hypothetical protein F899_01631 [Acinetobacter sp. CIP 101934]|nr:hypothetical protein F899_01631 [Acinetobacter sp. CIP 101934]
MSHTDEQMEQEIQDKGLEAPRVTLDQIKEMMKRVQYVFEQPEGTTSTFAHAFLNGDFYLATGHTACISKENFDPSLGIKYAQEEAAQKAQDKLWELEGYNLYRNPMMECSTHENIGAGINKLLETRIPILDQIYDLCLAIEKCGASPELTDAVTKAGALREPISELVNQALALGIGEGIASVSFSNSPKAELGEVLPEDPKEPSESEEGSKLCSGSAVGYSSTFTDPNLIAQLQECLGNRHIKSYGLHELVVVRLAKELGGSADDIKVNSSAQKCANNCDTASSDALAEASNRGLGDLLPEFPWESIPTQQVLKYVGPVAFAYVWAVTNEQQDYWTCTISVNHAPEPTPSITQSGITEEVAFAAAIRTLKEIAYKNEWVLG